MKFSFKTIFLKGLGVLLPTVMTIWILVTAYQFVDQYIAKPINTGVKELILIASPWPTFNPETDRDIAERAKEHILEDNPVLKSQLNVRHENELRRNLESIEQQKTEAYLRAQKADSIADLSETQRDDLLDQINTATSNEIKTWEKSELYKKIESDFVDEYMVETGRLLELNRYWNSVNLYGWPVLDIIGLLVAIFLIYIAGLVFGSYIGRNIIIRLEGLLKRVPLFKQVYPYVKQVVDFFISDNKQMEFNRVVAVQYPRKGIWSLGLLTGGTMKSIQEAAGHKECVTIFVPSSPTPFTGYVITVPVEDTVELPISIDDALRFTVSGGVIVPESQIPEMINKAVADHAKQWDSNTTRPAEIEQKKEVETTEP